MIWADKNDDFQNVSWMDKILGVLSRRLTHECLEVKATKCQILYGTPSF